MKRRRREECGSQATRQSLFCSPELVACSALDCLDLFGPGLAKPFPEADASLLLLFSATLRLPAVLSDFPCLALPWSLIAC